MAWANALILGVGGALLTLPIILHFLMQPKPKKVDLPTLRFLQQRSQSTRSRMRLRHMLLLFLRCLVIALVTLALAGPAVASREFGNWLTLGGVAASGLLVAGLLAAALLRSNRNVPLVTVLGGILLAHLAFGGWSAMTLLGSESSSLLGDSQTPVAAVVLIDTSPRMSYRSNNATRLERAQEIATWLVQQFPENSRVCVLATDNDEPFFSVDLGAAARRIETLETNFVSATIPQTFNSGLALLEQADEERKEAYVLTDLTQTSWAGEGSRAVARRLAGIADLNVMVVDVGDENVSNFSLTPLDLSAFEITETDTLSISTQLDRIGPAGQRSVKLSVEQPDLSRPVMRDGVAIYSDEAWEQQTTVDVRENGATPVEFRFQQSLEPGIYHGQVEIIGNDSLEIDNRRYFTFQVSERWKTLIVAPQGVSTRNLLSTISPARAQELGQSMYECAEVDMQEFAAMESLGEYEAVFLVDPEPMGDLVWKRLSAYANAGGGVVIFAGHNAADGPLAAPAFRSAAAAELMGARLTRQWRSAEGDLFLSPAEQEMAHPLFRSFRKIESGVPWNRFPVFLHWGTELGSDQTTANVLLRYSNREPALLEHLVGNGRVFTLTTPISEPSWSDDRAIWNELFLGKPLPAWLLTRAIARLAVANDADSLNVQVGQAAAFENDLRTWPESYRVFTPAADGAPAKVNAIDGMLRYRFTDLPGHYRLKGRLDGPVQRGFSTRIESSATDLTRLDPNQLDPVFGADRYEVVRQKEEIRRQQGTNRRGKEFYPLLMLLLLVAMSVEQLISSRFYGA